MKILITFFYIFLSIISVQAKECAHSLYEKADNDAVRFENWRQVYDYEEKYNGCIGSDTSEILSESIVRILAEKWEQLPDLKKLIKKNKKFEEFVFSSIDSTVSGDDLLKINDLAKKQCPKNSQTLCSKIGRKALRAYKEMDEF
ncbi:hypothetical protein [Zymobacter sp. IVIA_12111.31 C1]|uniref:hypothetical protein n=1 Tax=Zymobacter sp. IVIA_12111.31 C1 TaxID=3394854 RepID=UPI0039C10F5C